MPSCNYDDSYTESEDGESYKEEVIKKDNSSKRRHQKRSSLSSQRKENTIVDDVRQEEDELVSGCGILIQNLISSEKGLPTVFVNRDTPIGDTNSSVVCIFKHGNDPMRTMKLGAFEETLMVTKDTDILIKVEASTVSPVDCEIREGKYKFKFGQRPSLPIIPGVDCVGVIESCGSKADKMNLHIGDRVAALTLFGCNSKFVKVSMDDVVKVPDQVNPFRAVSAIRSYLTAFQALMHNDPDESVRYDSASLADQRVLVVGGFDPVNRAIVELAFVLGAKQVYAAVNREHIETFQEFKAKCLSSDPKVLVAKAEGRFDLAVDSACTDFYASTLKTLKDTGRFVGIGMSHITKTGNGVLANVDKLWAMGAVALTHNGTYYNGIIHSFQNNKKQFKNDLEFVFSLLKADKIHPKVAMKVPLSKVPLAHKKLSKNAEEVEKGGVIVVEPWEI